MKTKIIYIFCILSAIIASVKTQESTNYTMCIIKSFYDDLLEINNTIISNTFALHVVPGNDLFDCMDKVESGEISTLLSFDIHPIWIAANTPKYEHLRIITEFLPNRDGYFKNEAVAIIRKDVEISSLNDLRGLNSCFRDTESDSKFIIPYLKLKEFGILKEKYDQALSAKENQLKDFSKFFGKACVLHEWSLIPDIDTKLKTKYPNLVELCKLYDDEDDCKVCKSELDCLTKYGGDIAWSDRQHVIKYFGLKKNDTKTANEVSKNKANPDNYMYLCPDGTKQALHKTNSCTWTGNPWLSIMASSQQSGESLEKLQKNAKEALKIVTDEMFSMTKTHYDYMIDNSIVKTPIDILQRSNYSNMIIKDEVDGYKLRTFDFCVKTQLEMDKCQSFSKLAYVFNYRPSFNCVLKHGVKGCLKHIKSYGGVTSIDPYYIDIAKNDYNLLPILAENYSIPTEYLYDVAVIKKDSKFASWSDLRGTRSCHVGYGSTSGYVAPLYTLLQSGLIEKNTSPFNALSEFFSGGSCLPGSLSEENNQNGTNPKKLCSQCTTKTCNSDSTEEYYGDLGVLKCLVDGKGDVAFMKHIYLNILSEAKAKHNIEWTKGIKQEDFQLLCPDGNRVSVTKPENCALINEPPFTIVTKSDQPETVIDEIKDVLVDAFKYFNLRDVNINLMGPYRGHVNILFQEITSKLEPYENFKTPMEQYSKIIHELRSY